jgi:predicted small lipoprotein YifL
VIFMMPSVFFYRAAPAGVIVLAALLAGCGQKGPLVLPTQATAPAQATAQATAQAQNPSVPAQGAESPPPAAQSLSN